MRIKISTVMFLLFVGSMMMHAQNAQVSISDNSLQLGELINQIEKQTDYLFVMGNDIDKTIVVQIPISKGSVETVLNSSLPGVRLSYRFSNNYITLLKRASSQTAVHVAQPGYISGTVADESGQPIIGAAVVVEGTTNGVVTDMNGYFEIRVSTEAKLEVSCIGYTTQVVAAYSNMSIILQEDTVMLAETVVVGYGTMKKSDVTGAMVSVSAKELTSRPTNNVFEALQGKAAGVDIRTSERPGEIGSIYIRGQRSITASSTPLFVVDGIPLINGSLDSWNPNDIESIEILKDASATAIYGSRGANGVVLVTTKKGSADKLAISYNGSFTIDKMVDKSTWMTADEYITWRRYAYYNLDPISYPSPKTPTRENDYLIFNGGGDIYAWRNIEKGWEGGNWDGSKVTTTDWFSMIVRHAITHEHTISASGGSDKAKTYTSFGYLDNNGVIRGQDFKRFTLKSNNDFAPYKWISLGFNINATYSIQNYGLSGAGNFQGGSQSSAYGVATQGFPYAVPFDDDGNRIQYPGADDRVKNVYGEWDYQTDLRKTFRVTSSVYAQFNIDEIWAPLRGLSYRLNFGPDFSYYDRGLFVSKESFNRAGSNYALNTKTNSLSWTLDNILSYDRTFNKHQVGATLLFSMDASDDRSMSMDAEAIPLESSLWNNMGSVSSLRSFSTGLTQRQMVSYRGVLITVSTTATFLPPVYVVTVLHNLLKDTSGQTSLQWLWVGE